MNWIRVEERLPPIDPGSGGEKYHFSDWVLVYRKRENDIIFSKRGEDEESPHEYEWLRDGHLGDYVRVAEVSHWMPLPVPPEEAKP